MKELKLFQQSLVYLPRMGKGYLPWNEELPTFKGDVRILSSAVRLLPPAGGISCSRIFLIGQQQCSYELNSLKLIFKIFYNFCRFFIIPSG